MDDFACHVLKRATARNWAIERKARHVIAKRLTFFHRPMLDDVPSGIKRCVVIERSEERSVGKECVSTCRSRWTPNHYKTTTYLIFYSPLNTSTNLYTTSTAIINQ